MTPEVRDHHLIHTELSRLTLVTEPMSVTIEIVEQGTNLE